MEKFLTKLSGVCSAEDLNEIKQIFEAAVDEKVKAQTEKIAQDLAKKADEFSQTKIKEAKEQNAAKVEEMANAWCAEQKALLEKEANEKVEAYKKKLEDASENYIFEYFEKKFKEKYGEELEALEEKVITGLDKYLEYNINEKIDPSLIKKQAMTETYAPIIDGIKRLFEEEYVPMDLSGSKKIRDMKATNAELEESLKKQVSENMRLAELVEISGKKSLIAEKTASLSVAERAKVKKFFKDKSLNETKRDIDPYIEMVQEQTENYETVRRERAKLFEQRERPVRKSRFVEDTTAETLTERFRKQEPEVDSTTVRASQFC